MSKWSIVGSNSADILAPMSGNSAAAAGYIESWPRHYLLEGLAESGRLSLCYFTPAINVPIVELGFITGSVGAAGSTMSRMALFTVAADNSLTKVAQTANVPTFGGQSFTTHVAPLATAGGFPATYSMVAGRRYALGWLFVGTTPPKIRIGDIPDPNQIPLVARFILGQTDIAASYTNAQLGNHYQPPYFVARP